MREKLKNIFNAACKDYLNNLAPQNPANLDLVKSYLHDCVEAVKAVHERGGTGVEVAALRTIAMDKLICELFNLAGKEYCLRYRKVDQNCTIVALGGYGRGELAPASDIDIMFLYPWKVGPYTETVIERVLYILWDTGLDVGYSTRNINDCIKVSEDIVIKTYYVFICM